MPSSSEKHRWPVPMNQTAEVTDKGTKTMEELGFLSSTAALYCSCVLLIILGSRSLSRCLQELNAQALHCVVRALGSFGLHFTWCPYTCCCTNRWRGPHSLVSTDGKSDVAICLWNRTPLALLCRGGVACQSTGSHQNGHPHPRSHHLLLLKTRRGLATLWAPHLQQLPWRQTHIKHLILDLIPVYLQNISLARTWSSCFFSTDFFFFRSQLLKISGNKSSLNFIIPSPVLDTEDLGQRYCV